MKEWEQGTLPHGTQLISRKRASLPPPLCEVLESVIVHLAKELKYRSKKKTQQNTNI